MTEPLVQHVSDTAFLIAHQRSVESARADALFVDPLAARLAGSRGRAIAERMVGGRLSAWMVAVRTRLIDELLQEAIARGVDTVVNLGAGLDTRPYRMHLPSTLSWVEVDYPDVIAFKEQQLATETPRCRLERIAVDLVQAPARRAMLAQLDRRGGRMLILTEGVVPYLDLQAVGALAEELRALDHLEGWLVDYVSPQALAFRKRTRIGRQMGQAQFKFDPADWFAFFADRGWRAREIRYLVAEGKRWGRRAPLPWPMRLLMRLLARLARPEARERFARFSAYVLLEADRTARS